MVYTLIFLAAVALAPQAPDERPAVVSGRVLDAGTGRPVAGAIVTPAGTAVPPGLSGQPAPVPRALTNAEGQFVLRGLRAGSLVLTATKGGYIDATYGQRRPGGSAQPIPVEAGQKIADVDVRMWRHGSISGTVTDEAGDPAVGTRVQAFLRNYVAGRRRYAPAGSTATDDRGMYRIAGLTPGEYIVAVPIAQRSVPAELMEAFFSGPAISDTKRMELSRELNEIGSAIAPPGSPYAMRIGGQTLTLQAGTLAPAVAGGGILIYPTQFYPAAATAAQAGSVAVRSGEEHSEIDFQVSAVRGVRISGTLIGADGPAATTGIRLTPAGSGEIVDRLETATTVSDADGAFTFPAVPPGEYVLRVVRIPRSPVNPDDSMRITVTPSLGAVTIAGPVPTSSGPPPPSPIPADATLCAQVPLSIGNRDVSDLVVALTPGPRVLGRIEFDGTIDKPELSGLTGTRITLEPAEGSRLDERTLSFQTGHPDEYGQFSTYGVPPGRYVLNVSPVPSGWFFKGAFYQGRDVADVPLDLESKDIDGVVVTFTDRPSTITGVVRDRDALDGDAVVIAYPTDAAAWSSSGARPRRMRTARADRAGGYTFTGLPPGEYYVVAVKEDKMGDWQDPALLQALTRLAQTVRLVEGERKAVDLTAAEIR